MNGGNMLTIYYSGLIAFDIPTSGAEVARAMLVTPHHAKHLPRLLVDYETIASHSGIDIEMPVDARTIGSRTPSSSSSTA